MRTKALFWIVAFIFCPGGPLPAHPVIVNNWSAVRWYLSLPADDGTMVRVEIAPASKKFEPAKSTFEVPVPECTLRLPLWDCAKVSNCDIVLTRGASAAAPKVAVDHRRGPENYGVSVDADGVVQIFSESFIPPDEAPDRGWEASCPALPMAPEGREERVVHRIQRDRLNRAMKERNRRLARQAETYETKVPAHAPAPVAKAPEPRDPVSVAPGAGPAPKK
jgi:hypothetical protein